jgi:4-diphosphocytidyl-2-C-methyl-D-erythritol kinase
MELERLAPAKVNLFLHVGPLGDDGYHPICSLVTFADVGDRIRLRHAREPGFALEGPFADALAGEPDNLVLRARDLALARYSGEPPALHLTLEKRLPIAAGLGGGSSDAAATLMLIAELFDWDWLDDGEDALERLAASLGADAPMCLRATPVIAEGRGDALDYPMVFPDLDAVLVNPLVPSHTGAVYRAFDDAGARGGAEAPEWPDPLETPRALAAFLSHTRNDLEAPAIALQPAIGQVLAALRARPETLFARMSGSGATCFALCDGEPGRRELARAIANDHPDWWVQPCRLAGYRP